jgi:hypothetical protein
MTRCYDRGNPQLPRYEAVTSSLEYLRQLIATYQPAGFVA